jgi:hypothetical protein
MLVLIINTIGKDMHRGIHPDIRRNGLWPWQIRSTAMMKIGPSTPSKS